MSARRWTGMVAGALLGLAAAAAPAPAQDSILVQVGGELAARAGQYVDVPVTVDLSAAPGRSLGGYQITLRFDPAVLQYAQTTTGSFAAPAVNTDSVTATGRVLYAALQPSGAAGSVLLFTVRFYVVTDLATSPVTVTVDRMTAAAGSSTPFEDLQPLVRVVSGTFCGALGRWGDVDGDSASNSRDALMALSAVVGLPPAPGTTPALADVDGDGAVTSRDALIILSHAVGLPVTGFRIMLTATGPACATGTATRVVIAPDTVELVTLQEARVAVTALDAAGRAVPAADVRWRALDPSVAGHNGTDVVGRGPGTTQLIAELGAAAADTLTVNVVARRSTWYVDVRRARNVVTQTGTLRHPMEFIGDALDQAADGDTVRVAGGIYEEVINESSTNVILGDSLDRPVIDPRAAPFWSPTYYAMELLGAGRQVLAHVVIRAGGARIEGSAVTVRWVHVDSAETALRIRALPDYANPAPGLGLLGNVLVDSVSVSDFRQHGVLIEEADTAEVRNSRISGQLMDSEGCSSGSASDEGNIVISDATRGWVHDNVLDGGPCQGIGVFASAGRAVIQRNLVRNIAVSGIIARAHHVAMDHNAVRTFGRDPLSNYYDTRRGILIARDPCYYCGNAVVPDSVLSVADTVVDIYGHYSSGFEVDTARVTVIDQLHTDSIGVDSSVIANAVHFFGLRLTLTNSRIRRTGRIGLAGAGTMDVFLRGNRFDGAEQAVRINESYAGGYPDTVVIVGDTVTGVLSSGIAAVYAAYVRVDSAVVDSVPSGDGVYLWSVSRALVARSRLQRAVNGVASYYSDTVTLVGDTIQNNIVGVGATGGADTLRIAHSVITGNSLNGVDVSSRTARVDSTVVSGNGGAGVVVNSGGLLRMRHARVDGNGVGVVQAAGAGGTSFIRQSRIAGNLNQRGARNDDYPSTTLDADSVWWGDPAGPNCPAIVGTCPSTGADSVLTQGIVFAGFLTAAPPTPAPPAFRPIAPRPSSWAPTTASPHGRPRAPAVERPVVRRPERRAVQPQGPQATAGERPRLSWQRGREPRPPAPPRDR